MHARTNTHAHACTHVVAHSPTHVQYDTVRDAVKAVCALRTRVFGGRKAGAKFFPDELFEKKVGKYIR